MTSPWPLAFAIAGALAVPLHPVATPVAAAVACLLGILGLRLWRWSRLPELMRRSRERWPWLPLWIVPGFAVGLLILAVLRLAIQPAVPAIFARIAAAGALPVWRRLVIIYVAAVGEELVFRLILLSAVAGITLRLRRVRAAPTPAIAWAANVVAALAFGAAHVPSWTGIGLTSPPLLAAVVGLNLVAGLVLGYVFTTRGLAAAIWTHAGADCTIQLAGPLLQ
jgi:Type II CAAX prenyl endopeptidase Rce1-like